MDNTIILSISVIVSAIFVYFFIKDIFSIKQGKSEEFKDKRDFLLKNKSSISTARLRSFSPISTTLLKNDINKLDQISFEIRKIIDAGYEDPSLLDELEDFFISNMTQDNKLNNNVQDLLLILFNKIAENNTPRHNHFIGKILVDIVNFNYIEFDALLKQIRDFGTKELKFIILEYFISSQLYNKKENYFKIILNTFNDSNDDYIFKNLADYYANQFSKNQDKTLKTFDSIFPSLNFSNLKKNENNNFFAFLSEFSVKILIDSNGNLDNLTKYIKFLYNKYSFLKSLFNDNIKNPINIIIKKEFYKVLESSGINQWEKAIGNLDTNRAINNKFFIKTKGETNELIQRDELYFYYKYLVKIHNTQFDELTLKEKDDFYKQTLNCINFHEYSVIGYVATLALSAYALQNKDSFLSNLNFIIELLLKQKTKASKFFLFILCDGLLKISNLETENSKGLIRIAKNKIIPLKKEIYTNINMFFFLDNTSLPLVDNRNYYYEILKDLITEEALSNQFDELKQDVIQTCFLSNAEIGKFLAQYIIDSNLVLKDKGRLLLINLLGALYYRDREFVKEFIRLVESVRNIYISEWDIINTMENCHENIRDARSYQTNWNQLLIQAFINDKKLRYYVIKDLLGGLTQSNSVEDFSKEFRRFILELAKGYLFDTYPHNILLTCEDAFSSAESKRIENNGKEYKINLYE